jgi:hypothetical protein
MVIKSTKEPTKIEPFNLTKPKPFKIPEPIKLTKSNFDNVKDCEESYAKEYNKR